MAAQSDNCTVNNQSLTLSITDPLKGLLPDSAESDLKYGFAEFVNKLSNALINLIGKILNFIIPGTSALKDYDDFNLDEYGNFYQGMQEFLDSPAENAQWSLGYAQESILPDDFGEVPYTMGGYDIMAQTTETFDGLYVRTIVLNDGAGRGNSHER